jgi:hypothetical protein
LLLVGRSAMACCKRTYKAPPMAVASGHVVGVRERPPPTPPHPTPHWEKSFEIDRENRRHRKKSLKLTVFRRWKESEFLIPSQNDPGLHRI